MRTTYRVLAYTVATVVAVQAASVALAFFTIIHEVDDGGVFTSDYDLEGNLGLMVHRVGGMGIIPLAALALLVVSFFTRAPGAVRWASAVLGLVVLQIALVFGAFAAAWVGGLHGANAIALFLTALWAGRRISRVVEQHEEPLDTVAA